MRRGRRQIRRYGSRAWLRQCLYSGKVVRLKRSSRASATHPRECCGALQSVEPALAVRCPVVLTTASTLLRFIQDGRVQSKVVDHIAGHELVLLCGGQACREAVERRLGVGPLALNVREVGGEHDVLDPEVVSELNCYMFRTLDAEQEVVLDVLAGLPLQRLEAKVSLRPVAMPLVPEVGLLHPERHPSQARLGKEDA